MHNKKQRIHVFSFLTFSLSTASTVADFPLPGGPVTNNDPDFLFFKWDDKNARSALICCSLPVRLFSMSCSTPWERLRLRPSILFSDFAPNTRANSGHYVTPKYTVSMRISDAGFEMMSSPWIAQ